MLSNLEFTLFPLTIWFGINALNSNCNSIKILAWIAKSWCLDLSLIKRYPSSLSLLHLSTYFYKYINRITNPKDFSIVKVEHSIGMYPTGYAKRLLVQIFGKLDLISTKHTKRLLAQISSKLDVMSHQECQKIVGTNFWQTRCYFPPSALKDCWYKFLAN